MLKELICVFITGGMLCLIAQVIMDATKLVAGEILVLYISSGVILSALGIYEPLVKFGKCGATIPLTGFGYTLVKATIAAVEKDGLIGVFTGGLSGAAAGICAAILFGYIFALTARSKTKF